MGEVVVRAMRPEDLEVVMRIERESNPLTWSQNVWMEELTKNQVANHVVAEVYSLFPGSSRLPDPASRTGVVGFAGCWIVHDEANIVNVAVDPAWRRKGIGDRLMRAVLELARARGAKMVTLEVRSSNEPAIKLYEKFGFTMLAIRKAFYQQPVEDAYVYWLNPLVLGGQTLTNKLS